MLSCLVHSIRPVKVPRALSLIPNLLRFPDAKESQHLYEHHMRTQTKLVGLTRAGACATIYILGCLGANPRTPYLYGEYLCTKRAIHNLEVKLSLFYVLCTHQKPSCVTPIKKRGLPTPGGTQWLSRRLITRFHYCRCSLESNPPIAISHANRQSTGGIYAHTSNQLLLSMYAISEMCCIYRF